MFFNIKKALWIVLPHKAVFCAPVVPGVQSYQGQILPSPVSGTALLTSTAPSHEPGSRVWDCFAAFVAVERCAVSLSQLSLAVQLSWHDLQGAPSEWAQPRDRAPASPGLCPRSFWTVLLSFWQSWYQLPRNSSSRFCVPAGICCVTGRSRLRTSLPGVSSWAGGVAKEKIATLSLDTLHRNIAEWRKRCAQQELAIFLGRSGYMGEVFHDFFHWERLLGSHHYICVHLLVLAKLKRCILWNSIGVF